MKRRKLDRTMTAVLTVTILAALVGCSPSCVVYQNQQQGCPVPSEARP